MAARIVEMRAALKTTGTFYLHCDWRLAITMPNGAQAECLFEVKGGAAGVGKLRDFITAVANENAAMGVFICFASRLGNLRREADKHGNIGGLAITPHKIQILAVEDLLSGRQPDFPRRAR